MSEQHERQEQAVDNNAVVGASMEGEPLSELDALRTRTDALERAAHTATQGVLSKTQGRVEEETFRLSERMTHEEQERRTAMARQKAAPVVTATHPRRAAAIRISSTLVALDGTTFAMRAIPYAAALAHLTGSALTLGSSTPPQQQDVATGSVAEPWATVGAGQAEHGLETTLISARERLAAAGLTAQAKIVYAHNPAQGLIDLQQAIDANALALATHARQGVERVILGSVADAVVRRGREVTLIVPPLAPEAAIQDCVFARALAPLDGSDLSEEALRVIWPLLHGPDQHGAGVGLRALTLLYVAGDHALVNDGERYLRHMRDDLLREATIPIDITTKVMVGSPPGAIVAWAIGGEPASAYAGRHDLIIMGTHGRGRASQWLFGSVATYAVAHSDVPVLLVRAQG